MKKDKNGDNSRELYKQGMAALAADNEQAKKEEAERNLPPVICLGREGKNHVFYSTESRYLYRLSAEKINWPNLLDMATREHWERWLFPQDSEAGDAPSKKELVDTAQERLLDDSRCKTFSPDSVRARGVWPDAAGGWLYNAGSECWHIPADCGKPEQVQNVRKKHIYSRGVTLPAPADIPLTDEEGKQIVELFTARPWTLAGAGDMLAGWTVAALLAGMLPICPHIWVDSQKHTGKTSLKDDLSLLFGDFCGVSMDKIPSEAGLRQSVKGDCLPVLIDEAEPEKMEKCAGMMDLIRTASYGGNVYTGSTDGTPRAYWVKCSMMLFSTANGIEKDTDATRFFVLSLRRVSNKTFDALRERRDKAQALIARTDFHSRLIARLLALLPMIKQSIEECSAFLKARNVQGRRADLLAVLMAGRHALTSCTPMAVADMERAAGLLAAYDEQDDIESDFSRCLGQLLSHKVNIHGTGERTVADACVLIMNNAAPEILENTEAALRIVGLRWRADKEALQVDPRAVTMKRIYAGTQWSNGKIKPVLAEGCIKGQGANAAGIWLESARLTGTQNAQECIFIPRELIEKE